MTLTTNTNQPTIGRIVHYVAYGTPKGEYKPEHRAAIITTANENNICGLCVINPTGIFFNTNVPHDETEKAGGTWHWPERIEPASK